MAKLELLRTVDYSATYQQQDIYRIWDTVDFDGSLFELMSKLLELIYKNTEHFTQHNSSYRHL